LLSSLNKQSYDNSIKNIVEEVKEKFDCMKHIQSDINVIDERMSFNCSDPLKKLNN